MRPLAQNWQNMQQATPSRANGPDARREIRWLAPSEARTRKWDAMERRQPAGSATRIRYLRIVRLPRIPIIMVFIPTPRGLWGVRFQPNESQYGMAHLRHIMIQSVHSSEHANNTTKQSQWRYRSRRYGRMTISNVMEEPLVPLFPARMHSPGNSTTLPPHVHARRPYVITQDPCHRKSPALDLFRGGFPDQHRATGPEKCRLPMQIAGTARAVKIITFMLGLACTDTYLLKISTWSEITAKRFPCFFHRSAVSGRTEPAMMQT